MGSRWLLPLLFSLTTSAVLAQSPPPAPSEPTVQSLLDRIQQLENRINQLEDRERKQEAAQAGTAAAPAPAETTTQAAVTPPRRRRLRPRHIWRSTPAWAKSAIRRDGSRRFKSEASAMWISRRPIRRVQ